MKRRQFLKSTALVGGVMITGVFKSCQLNSIRKLRFGISTDIHNDLMFDAGERLSTFLNVAEEKNLDFIIDLGDFCHPLEENNSFLDIWNSCPVQKYHVLGNHDMDKGTKEDFMDFIGIKNNYYSFDQGDFHCIVLDPNNLKIETEYIPYQNANFYKPTNQRAYLDPEQLVWLKADLEKTKKHCLIFSHQSFENPKACQNQEEVRAIFEEVNKRAGFQQVVACFSGHDHTDYVKEINDIHYIQINSMSYSWVGGEYKCPERFSDELNKKYPALQYTAPYEKPLFAMVTVSEGKLTVEGVEGDFIKPDPAELGLTDGTLRGLPFSASISDQVLHF